MKSINNPLDNASASSTRNNGEEAEVKAVSLKVPKTTFVEFLSHVTQSTVIQIYQSELHTLSNPTKHRSKRKMLDKISEWLNIERSSEEGTGGVFVEVQSVTIELTPIPTIVVQVTTCTFSQLAAIPGQHYLLSLQPRTQHE